MHQFPKGHLGVSYQAGLLARYDADGTPLPSPKNKERTGNTHRLASTIALAPYTHRVAIATLFTEGFSGFVTFATASIVTGQNEPVPGRDFHPLWTSAFSRRTFALELGDVIGGAAELRTVTDTAEQPASKIT